MPFDNPDVQVPVEATPLTILDDMLQLLATPDRWCQRSFYRYFGGKRKFCIIGALHAVAHGDVNAPSQEWRSPQDWRAMRTVAARQVQTRLNKYAPYGCAINFNDCVTTTHVDVVKLLVATRRSFEPPGLPARTRSSLLASLIASPTRMARLRQFVFGR